MRHGSVYQRHSAACPDAVDGIRPAHRCRSPWAFQIDYGRDNSGQRRQVTKGGFPTKAAARAALEDMTSVLMSDVDAHRLTVAAYLESWLLGKHALKPKTKAVYGDALNLYILPNLGSIKLQELRAHHLDRFYAAIAVGRRGKPLSNSTIRRIHAVLRSALTTAVKRRLIAYNPAVHIELAPENAQRPAPWSVEQVNVFLNATVGERLGGLYRLLLVTGMRRGEAIGLRWIDVDLDEAQLLVRQQITEVNGRTVVGTPKTKKSTRTVPLDARTVATLQDWRDQQAKERAEWGEGWIDSGLVFTREDGSALRPEYATRHFQALSKRHGLPRIRLHDLRHTNASLALDAGVDVKIVSHRLGHSTTSITHDLYTHVSDNVARAAADQIASLLGQPRTPSGADASEMQAGEP